MLQAATASRLRRSTLLLEPEQERGGVLLQPVELLVDLLC
jgi:hypothetical protein